MRQSLRMGLEGCKTEKSIHPFPLHPMVVSFLRISRACLHHYQPKMERSWVVIFTYNPLVHAERINYDDSRIRGIWDWIVVDEFIV